MSPHGHRVAVQLQFHSGKRSGQAPQQRLDGRLRFDFVRVNPAMNASYSFIGCLFDPFSSGRGQGQCQGNQAEHTDGRQKDHDQGGPAARIG